MSTSIAEVGEAPPVCSTHPDRVSYVRCQRCDKPVCPECMHTAAVGVQCASCVAGVSPGGTLGGLAAKGAARLGFQAPGRGVAAPRRTVTYQRRNMVGVVIPAKPLVTYSIVGLCVAMFAGQLISGGSWTAQFAFWPAIGALEPYRFITAAFLHSTSFFGHILFNMLAFWQCGQLLERALGHVRFLALCLVTALGGSIGYLLLAGGPGGTGWNIPVVGASGMVFGLFGALIPILRSSGNSVRQIVSLIAINAVLGFVVPGIAWQAHLGGLVVGLAMSWGFAKVPMQFQKLLAWVMPIGGAVLLAVAAFWYYSATGWLAIIEQLR